MTHTSWMETIGCEGCCDGDMKPPLLSFGFTWAASDVAGNLCVCVCVLIVAWVKERNTIQAMSCWLLLCEVVVRYSFVSFDCEWWLICATSIKTAKQNVAKKLVSSFPVDPNIRMCCTFASHRRPSMKVIVSLRGFKQALQHDHESSSWNLFDLRLFHLFAKHSNAGVQHDESRKQDDQLRKVSLDWRVRGSQLWSHVHTS